MGAPLEAFGLIVGLGLPLTFLAWGHLSPLAIKAAGAITITAVTGYVAFLTTAFVYGFATQLRAQRKGK